MSVHTTSTSARLLLSSLYSLTPNQHQPAATSQPAIFFLTTNQQQPQHSEQSDFFSGDTISSKSSYTEAELLLTACPRRRPSCGTPWRLPSPGLPTANDGGRALACTAPHGDRASARPWRRRPSSTRTAPRCRWPSSGPHAQLPIGGRRALARASPPRRPPSSLVGQHLRGCGAGEGGEVAKRREVAVSADRAPAPAGTH